MIALQIPKQISRPLPTVNIDFRQIFGIPTLHAIKKFGNGGKIRTRKCTPFQSLHHSNIKENSLKINLSSYFANNASQMSLKQFCNQLSMAGGKIDNIAQQGMIFISVHTKLKSTYFTYKPPYFCPFFSGIMQQDNSEQVIIDPALIAKHYIRTWFFLDLLSSIPLDYIYLIFSSSNDVSNRCI